MRRFAGWMLVGMLAILLVGCGKNTQSSERAVPLDIIFEETISPNEKYVENPQDRVYYTITVYRRENGVEVASSSNAAFSHDTSYVVETTEELSKDDIAVQWQTLTGSTSDSEDDEFALAVVTISTGGKVISQQTVSFIGGVIDQVVDAVGRD